VWRVLLASLSMLVQMLAFEACAMVSLRVLDDEET
jgi:hypothetical protein